MSRALGEKQLFYLQNLAQLWTIMAEFAIKDLGSSGDSAIFQHQSPYSSFTEMAVWTEVRCWTKQRTMIASPSNLNQALALKNNSKKHTSKHPWHLSVWHSWKTHRNHFNSNRPNQIHKSLAYRNNARVIKFHGLKNILHLVAITLHRTGVQEAFNLPVVVSPVEMWFHTARRLMEKTKVSGFLRSTWQLVNQSLLESCPCSS